MKKLLTVLAIIILSSCDTDNPIEIYKCQCVTYTNGIITQVIEYQSEEPCEQSYTDVDFFDGREVIEICD